MAKSDYSAQLDEVTFRCGACRATFSAAPGRVVEAPEREWHPWGYFSDCPECGAIDQEQAPWERALLKAWQNATGPRTSEGIAATAANLAGHPTPEEARRTRFNALKHGLSAKTATYFPARPGGYPFCAACDVDRGWCGQQAACSKQTVLFMQHHAAFEQRNPKLLNGVYADLQAALFALLQQIVQTIIADGVKVEAPKYYTDKDGQLIVAEYYTEAGERRTIMDIQAHPLFKPLGELLSRNNLSLADMGMTQKVQDDEEQEFGRLQSQAQSREALADFSARQAKALEDLSSLMRNAAARRDADPILIEHMQQSGSEA
jgi:hypothetical protein